MMIRIASAGMLLALCFLPVAAQPPAADLKVITYADLKQIVTGHRGKVVLVDFWEYG